MPPLNNFKRNILEQVAPYAKPKEVEKAFGISEDNYWYYTNKYSIPTYTQAHKQRKKQLMDALDHREEQTKVYLFDSLK